MTPARAARAPAAAAWAALALASCALLLFGVVGVGRGDGVRFADVRYFFLAGQLAAAGTSPYDAGAMLAASLQNGLGEGIDVYAYPPHSLPLSVLLSKLPLDLARALWGLVNVGLLLGLAWAMALRHRHRLEAAGGRTQPLPPAALWIAAIVLGNPFSAHLLWTGQTGLMVLACLLLAWHFDRRGHWLVAGLLLGLATVKPQLSLPVLAWFALGGRWRAAATALATAGALLAWPLQQFGLEVLAQWTASAAQYERQFSGSLAYNTNLRSLLSGLGLLPAAFTPAMLALALAGVAVLALRHHRRPLADEDDVQGVLLAGALFLVGGRDYDMAALAPLLPALFWHTRGDRRASALAALALLLLCVPQRALAPVDLPWLPYYRIALLGLLWLWALRLALRTPDRSTHIR